jgi:hypothetical protein
MSSSPFTLSRSRKIALAGLIAACVLLVPGPRSAQAGCITTLPLKWSLSSHYAEVFSKSMTVNITTDGPKITGLTVTLSTFDGVVLGQGSLSYALTGSASVTMKLKYAMQPGKYTLYFYGYPNADPSCGPKHNDDVLNLNGCAGGGLPVKFLKPTQGSADAYGGYYSFYLESVGGVLLHNLSATLRSAGGGVTGQQKIPLLFGRLYVSIPLRYALQPQQYTLAVSGYGPGRPRACGVARKQLTLTFN